MCPNLTYHDGVTPSTCGKLFQYYDSHISTWLILKHIPDLEIIDPRVAAYLDLEDSPQVEDLDLKDSGTGFLFTGLHCASFFGIVELVVALIEMGCYGTEEGDFWGYTPFAWAAWDGPEEVVGILLRGKEVNPDKPGVSGRTPLSLVAERRQEGVVKILLGREGINPDGLDSCNRTPLYYAAGEGHEEVVKMLLQWGEVDPDVVDSWAQHPSGAPLLGDTRV